MNRIIVGEKEVYLLVSLFYKKIRKDILLGPVFNGMIAEEDWEAHIRKLTNFWVTVLFGVERYKGNPGMVHKRVGKRNSEAIQKKHFDRWLSLWSQTIDENYDCEKAQYAKKAALQMSRGLYNVMSSSQRIK